MTCADLLHTQVTRNDVIDTRTGGTQARTRGWGEQEDHRPQGEEEEEEQEKEKEEAKMSEVDT